MCPPIYEVIFFVISRFKTAYLEYPSYRPGCTVRRGASTRMLEVSTDTSGSPVTLSRDRSSTDRVCPNHPVASESWNWKQKPVLQQGGWYICL